MERLVTLAPLQEGHIRGSSTASPLSFSTPAFLKSSSLPPIPFATIQSSTDVDDSKSDSDLTHVDSDAQVASTIPLSEPQLIARGKVLLRAYQSQKKEWLQQSGNYDAVALSQDRHSLNSTVRATHSAHDTNEESSSVTFSSPKTQSAACHSVVDGPSIEVKPNRVSRPPSPPSPPPRSIMSGLSNFSLPASELKINQQPLSGNKREKSWTDFVQLLKTNGQMMDMVDVQLTEIWNELVLINKETIGAQSAVEKLSQVVSELLLQKREAEIAIAKLVEVLGSRVFLTGRLADDAVQFVSKQLRLELEASQALVERAKMERIACKSVDIRNDGNVSLLRQQLQDKEQQVQASQAAVTQLNDLLAQQKQIAEDRQMQLEQALRVKIREIDALCSDVDLPTDYERTEMTEGIVCYRRKGHEDRDGLEDPRVPIALKLRSATKLAAASERAVDKETTLTSNGITTSGGTYRPRGISAMAREYAAHDSIMRRSSSSPHITHGSHALKDIHVPPDDGCKHTIEDFSTPLPAGWEMRVTASGAVFFFNKYTTTTTWTDPRLLGPTPLLSSAIKPLARNSSATRFEPRPSRSISITGNTEQLTTREEKDDLQYIDVVFKERGPIGIHFQANVPDLGATVRSLLPDMAAAKKGILEPYDELVAVNKQPVDSAPFRHAMLLLQGGLRPLTLTFKRNPNRTQRLKLPGLAAPSSDDGASLVSENEALDAHLDEEVVIDEGTVVDLEQLRVPIASSPTPAASEADGDENMNVADVIITNIFSLFWKPPETTDELQTV